MNEYYTFPQEMDRLGLRSMNAFIQLERKYPDVFVNVNPAINRDKRHWYDKAALDTLADTLKDLRNLKT